MQNVCQPMQIPTHHPHRCPWWIGWLLVSPWRRWRENPESIVGPVIRDGQCVLEIGPGMGFFTTTIATRVGSQGRVYCVDVQAQMLSRLRRRLERQGLEARVETRVCTATDLGVEDLVERIDTAVLIHVLHEMDEPRSALGAIAKTLRVGGQLLLIEPKGHVSPQLFEAELAFARECGLVPMADGNLSQASGPMARLLTRTH